MKTVDSAGLLLHCWFCTRRGSCLWGKLWPSSIQTLKNRSEESFSPSHLTHFLFTYFASSSTKHPLLSLSSLPPTITITPPQWLCTALRMCSSYPTSCSLPLSLFLPFPLPPPSSPLVSPAAPLMPLLLGSAELPNFSHHRTLTNILHDEAL